MSIDKRQVAFHLRHSTKEANLENQRFDLEAYRTGRGLSVDDIRVYSDVMSGLSGYRSSFEQMLRDAQEGLIEVIVCRDLSRMYRNVLQFVKLLKFLEKHNVRLISLRDPFEYTSAIGQAMSIIMSVINQLDSQVKSENIISGQQKAIRNGKKIGRKVGQRDKKPRARHGYFARYAKNGLGKKTSLLDSI